MKSSRYLSATGTFFNCSTYYGATVAVDVVVGIITAVVAVGVRVSVGLGETVGVADEGADVFVGVGVGAETEPAL